MKRPALAASSHCAGPTNEAHRPMSVQTFIQAQSPAQGTSCTFMGTPTAANVASFAPPTPIAGLHDSGFDPIKPPSFTEFGPWPARPGRGLMQRCWSLQQQGVWIGTEADWPARVRWLWFLLRPPPLQVALDLWSFIFTSSHLRSFQCSLLFTFSTRYLKFCRHCKHGGHWKTKARPGKPEMVERLKILKMQRCVATVD